jgi:hypothetical protein
MAVSFHAMADLHTRLATVDGQDMKLTLATQTTAAAVEEVLCGDPSDAVGRISATRFLDRSRHAEGSLLNGRCRKSIGEQWLRAQQSSE